MILIKLLMLVYFFGRAIDRHLRVSNKIRFEVVIFALLIIKVALIGINDFIVTSIYMTFFLFYF
jgi:hypothetical protein